MVKYIFFLGSHPALSATECFNVLKREGFSPKLQLVRARFLLVELNKKLPGDFLQSLGGIDRIATLLGKQSRPWTARGVMTALSPITARKLAVGVSTLEMPINYGKEIAKQLKNLWRQEQKKMRFILPKGRLEQLNAAQVLFNKLSREPNLELWFIRDKGDYYLAATDQLQDIQAYEKRDTRRPVRDSRVGMLPPKLAQIMLNLWPRPVPKQLTILDAFCGMGTILQEGWLMGHQMIGADVSARMIKATDSNLDWLSDRFAVAQDMRPTVFCHDARLPYPKHLHGKIDAIVSEPYLGEHPSSPLPPGDIKKRVVNLSAIYHSFFLNALPLLKEAGWIVFIIPAFKQATGQNGDFALFPNTFIDQVCKLGYSFKQLVPEEMVAYFASTNRNTLVYARPRALTGREMTLWQKK